MKPNQINELYHAYQHAGPLGTKPFSGLAGTVHPAPVSKSLSRAVTLAKNVEAGARLIFAEGDSWFDFPFILVWDRESDLLDALMYSNGYAVQRLSKAGDTVENMARPENLAALRAGFSGLRPDVFLFSGGGNDLCGVRSDGTSKFYDVLRPKGTGKPLNTDLLTHYLDGIVLGYERVLAEAQAAGVTSFIHSYAYAQPTGIGANYKGFTLAGPWLKPQLDARGYTNEAEAAGIVRQLIDALSERLRKLAKNSKESVRFVDLRSTILPGDWHDELHCLPVGWRKAAAKFHSAILDALGARTAARPYISLVPPDLTISKQNQQTPLAAMSAASANLPALGSSTLNQFVILPPQGIAPRGTSASDVRAMFGLMSSSKPTLAAAHNLGLLEVPKCRVIDAVHEDGAKLVEGQASDVAELRASAPGLRVVPVVHYRIARTPRPGISSRPYSGGPSLGTTLKVTERGTGHGVADVKVVAFTNFAARQGVEAVTDAGGQAMLAVAPGTRVERLYLFADHTHWSALYRDISLKQGSHHLLTPIRANFNDSVRHFHAVGKPTDGEGVRVAVIDTGVGPHRDLVVAGGENTVSGEAAGNWGNNGSGHGTHVAGIIAGRGGAQGVRGLAPGVELFAYRVFGQGADGASNFAIVKAIERAIAAQCDLINMSLGGGPVDDAMRSAIADARAAGIAVIVAAGNDYRQEVSFPASDPRAVAVSALGRKGFWPKDSSQEATVLGPFGADSEDFIADFSNVGLEIDLTGPGVGVISAYPGDRLAVMDGTSMACPAVTGMAARLLGRTPAVLSLPRDQVRSDAILKLVFAAARSLGFPPEFEGLGILH